MIRLRRPYWPTLFVPLALYGGVLAFQAYSYASGSTFPFLRFYIAAIPFAAALAMLAVPERGFAPATRRGKYAPRQWTRRRRAAVGRRTHPSLLRSH